MSSSLQLCPVVCNYVQHIFPGGEKIFGYGPGSIFRMLLLV